MTAHPERHALPKNTIELTGVFFHRKGALPKSIVLADCVSPFDIIPKGYFGGLYGYKSRLAGLADARLYASINARDMLVVDIVVQLSTPILAGTPHHPTLGMSELLNFDRHSSRALIDELAEYWQTWLKATRVANPQTLCDWAYPESFVPQRIDWVFRLFEVWPDIKLIVHPGMATYSSNIHKFGTFKLGTLEVVAAKVRTAPGIPVLF